MMEEHLMYNDDAVDASIIRMASDGIDVHSLNQLLDNLDGIEQYTPEMLSIEELIKDEQIKDDQIKDEQIKDEPAEEYVELSEGRDPPPDEEGLVETYVLLDESLVSGTELSVDLKSALESVGIEDGQEIILKNENYLSTELGNSAISLGENEETREGFMKYIILNGKGYLMKSSLDTTTYPIIMNSDEPRDDKEMTMRPEDPGAIQRAEGGGWQCPLCPHISLQKGKLNNHIEVAHGQIRHECSICPRSFCSSALLKKHIAFHSNPHKCKYCNKTFISDCGFQRHISIHEGTLQKYMCDICGLVLCNPHTFEAHMNRHNNLRPYECEKCGRAYENRDHLALHRKCSRSCDGDNKELYMCHLCGKGFTYKRHYKRHTLYSHKEASCRCDVCGRMLKSPDCLRAHLKTHQRHWGTSSSSVNTINNFKLLSSEYLPSVLPQPTIFLNNGHITSNSVGISLMDQNPAVFQQLQQQPR